MVSFAKWSTPNLSLSNFAGTRKMKTPLEHKSSLVEIEKRFDGDVERFANLESGQSSTIDAPLVMELISRAATRSGGRITRVLDIGCGAGNNTLKLLQYVDAFDCDLVDLSEPMLERAHKRIAQVNRGKTRTFKGDFLSTNLPEESYDVILAAAVLHHLRSDREWEEAFAKLFSLTSSGGSVWISDLVSHESSDIQNLMWERYGEYLYALGGEDYRDEVFAYIDREDSPRPVTYQLELLRRVGFQQVELLHKNSCFAAFGAIKKG